MVTRDPWIRALVIVMLSIAGLYLAGLIWQIASQFADILLLFFLAWVVAFILEPVVVFLRRHAHLPRSLAVTVAYSGLLVMLAGAVVWLVPPLSRQVVQVAVDLPVYGDFTNRQFLELQNFLEDRGLTVNLATLLNYEDLVRRAEAVAPPIVSNAVAIATRIASFFLQLAIVLILSYYVMLDGHRISRGLLRAVPSSFREDVVFFFASVNHAFAGFLRGQIIQALVYSLGVAAIMWVFGLDLILLTAVVNTLLMLIPFLGPPLALIMPLTIGFVENRGSFWAVVVLISLLQQVVLWIVAPRVMSGTIGLHPLLVFVGILGGARVAGIWGVVFGVPVMAVISAMVQFYHAMIEQRHTAERRPAPIETYPPIPDERGAHEPMRTPPVGRDSIERPAPVGIVEQRR